MVETRFEMARLYGIMKSRRLMRVAKFVDDVCDRLNARQARAAYENPDMITAQIRSRLAAIYREFVDEPFEVFTREVARREIPSTVFFGALDHLFLDMPSDVTSDEYWTIMQNDGL